MRRVNFAIIEVESGSVFASVGYSDKGSNPEIARAIANYLDSPVTGRPFQRSGWGAQR